MTDKRNIRVSFRGKRSDEESHAIQEISHVRSK